MKAKIRISGAERELDTMSLPDGVKTLADYLRRGVIDGYKVLLDGKLIEKQGKI